MLLAMWLGMQAAAGPAAACTVPADPQSRSWTLERRDEAWQIVFRSRALDRPSVILRLPNASPSVGASEIHLSYKSANGGRTIEWRVANGAGTLDLYVNHGLEVNVDADLDPAVDQMNTEGPIAVACRFDGAAMEVRQAFDGRSEWMVSAGVAKSVNLFESTSGRAYAVQTIGWGRELTQPWGPGVLRGRFAWAIEAMPVFAQFEPSAMYGVGFAPVVWRWNFTPQPRWSAFAELSMGGLWTTEPIPDDSGTVNFTAHWGGGLRLRPRGPHAWLIGYRFQHFSNGNQIGSNDGVNSHVVLIGWSYRKWSPPSGG